MCDALGGRLLETAVASEAGVSWAADPHLRNRHNLTGFSHGTSGVAFALLELGVASGESKASSVGQSAFQVPSDTGSAQRRGTGRTSVSSGSEVAVASKKPRSRPSGVTVLPALPCRACERTHCSVTERVERKRLWHSRATRHNVESTLRDGRGNFSLCHGLTGNSDALLYGYETLGPGCEDLMSASRSVAQVGRERFASARAPWPCGTHSGETPGLMLGLAGIGHFYLRLHDPAVRRILILCDD